MKLHFDPQDLQSIKKLIQNHKGEQGTGSNESGEEIMIDVKEDRIEVSTFQHNKWVRVNVYYTDGSSEEYFEGMWN